MDLASAFLLIFHEQLSVLGSILLRMKYGSAWISGNDDRWKSCDFLIRWIFSEKKMLLAACFHLMTEEFLVIPDTINESPFFSYLQVDPHPDMISITFQLLGILPLLNIMKSNSINDSIDWPSILIVGLVHRFCID